MNIENNKAASDKKNIGRIINSVLGLMKFLCFMMFLIFAGATIGLIVLSIVKGRNIPNPLIAQMVSTISSFSKEDVINQILLHGKVDTVVACCGFGFAMSITYFVLAVVVNTYTKVIRNITRGKVFSPDNVRMIKDTVPITFVLLLTEPVIVTIIDKILNISYDISYISLSGIFLTFISYIVSSLMDSGLKAENKALTMGRKLNKIQELKNEEEILRLQKAVSKTKSPKKVVKEEDVKKAEPKKEEVKKVEVKKAEPKKETVKKLEVKKTEPKKETVKKTVIKKEVKAPVKKGTPKKEPIKKTEVKKTTTKKETVKKAATTKKAEPKKTVKKTTKKTTSK